jgi:putative hemolysin
MRPHRKISQRIMSRPVAAMLAGAAENTERWPFRLPFGLPLRRADMPGPLGSIGSLDVRLARSSAEVRIAQRLRYRVFYEEMSAVAGADALRIRRDRDGFDPICDHLLVVDRDRQGFRGISGDRNRGGFGAETTSHLQLFHRRPAIVGTYRLLRQEIAELNGGFYSAGEYNVTPVIDRHPGLRFLELGRSCVLMPYRNKRTVELLWHGIWSYVLMHGIDVMFGCASLDGTNADRLAPALSFLHHKARAPKPWRVGAVCERYVEMNRMPADAIDERAVLRDLPPLIKGYLRLGGFVADGAVIDHQFGTTDVLIILPVAAINRRYVDHYGADAGRFRPA